MMRAGVKLRNPDSLERPWIAEGAFREVYPILWDADQHIATYDKSTLLHVEGVDIGHFASRMQENIESAKAEYEDFLHAGVMGETLARAFVRLSQMDAIFRIGIKQVANVNPLFDPVDREDDVVEDILGLYDLVPWNEFGASTRCALNPTFGDAGRLVGGADADLVVDGRLLDIKTVQRPRDRFTQTVNQLVGYCLLSILGGIAGQPWQITELGVYYSRQALLISFPISQLIPGDITESANWFEGKASENRPTKDRKSRQ